MSLALALPAAPSAVGSPNEPFRYEGALYSYRDNTSCHNSNRVDPIGVVFHGPAASIEYIGGVWPYIGPLMGNFQSKVGWGRTSGSNQLYYSHGDCYSDRRQKAQEAHKYPGRFHIRLWEQPTNKVQFRTVGTPHHERDCPNSSKHGISQGAFRTPQGGIVKNGYDYARLVVQDKYSRRTHYKYHSEKWPNTARMPQCRQPNGKYLYSVPKGPNVTVVLVGK